MCLLYQSSWVAVESKRGEPETFCESEVASTYFSFAYSCGLNDAQFMGSEMASGAIWPKSFVPVQQLALDSAWLKAPNSFEGMLYY